MMGCRLQV